jgi:hypothetical protein
LEVTLPFQPEIGIHVLNWGAWLVKFPSK